MRVPRVPGSKVTVISRRQLIAGASAAGGVLQSSTWPAFAQDDDDEGNHASCDLRLCPSPNAIPHVNKKTAGFGTFHFYFPGPVEGTTAATDGEPGGTEPGGRDQGFYRSS